MVQTALGLCELGRLHIDDLPNSPESALTLGLARTMSQRPIIGWKRQKMVSNRAHGLQEEVGKNKGGQLRTEPQGCQHANARAKRLRGKEVEEERRCLGSEERSLYCSS